MSAPRAERIRISWGELLRLAPDALRMAGMPFGQADGGVEGIAWTQAVLGFGMAEVCRAAAQGQVGRPIAGGRLSIRSDHVDLADRHLVATAARLADHLVATLDADAEASITVGNVRGGWMTPYIVHCATRAGLSVIADWQAAADDDDEPSRLIAVGLAGHVESFVAVPRALDIGEPIRNGAKPVDGGNVGIAFPVKYVPGLTITVCRDAVQVLAALARRQDATVLKLDAAVAIQRAIDQGMDAVEADFRGFERLAMDRWLTMKPRAA